MHLLLAGFIKVIKPGWRAREERGARATSLQLSGNLVHAMSTLPDVHKAQESLMSTGMFLCSVLPVCVAELLGDYFITILAEGRSLRQLPGEETHHRPAPSASGAAESGTRRIREEFCGSRVWPLISPSSRTDQWLLCCCFLAAGNAVVVWELLQERWVSVGCSGVGQGRSRC